ncbi:HEAT repeat domain-containing protein [Ktedonospora formicarum]|uniref:Uncharacterized protein n=1 Tax=Ktedonospora formicarum TaxID=2778364 RepID=A0A8J3MUR1_9CHLR|nr:hypothetical protein [Ktedonospora formicarum]GHO48490.1 hypothetical protein KSX_66530 [Ktedonospora formicarum]
MHCTLLHTHLAVELSAASIPQESPQTHFVAGSDDFSMLAEPPHIRLGTMHYPANGEPLPPVLLIEQTEMDNPTRSPAIMRFLGQLILTPEMLGEPLWLTFTREALTYWQQQAAESPLHQQAMRHRTQGLDALFHLPLEGLPSSVREQQQRAMYYFAPLLSSAGEEAEEMLRLLSHLSRLKPHWRPVPWLFAQLHHLDAIVRSISAQLQLPLAHLLPFERLDAIAMHADVPQRVLALHLIGHSLRPEAEVVLLSTRWLHHPLVRSASLEALVACQGYESDLLAALETALCDRHALVRWTAAWHLAHLVLPSAIHHVLLSRWMQEPDALIRCFLHLSFLRSVRWLS